MGLPVTPQVTFGIHVPLPQMKKKKGSTYICGWVSKGNASSFTMPQPLGYEVDTGECMDIATMGSTTIKADQVANQWGYYTGGEGTSSSSSKGKKQAAAAPTSQQQQLIQQQQPKRQQPTPGGKQTRHYTPQIAAAAASAARQRGEGMDVDECTDEDENFEDDPAEAMDEDDPAPGRKGGDEDPADADDDDADDNPGPKPKARTKVTKEGHKGKAKHPSFLIEGPASGGSTSISARPTRKEKTLASASFQGHWDRARETIREQLGCSVQQLAHHYKSCQDIGGCGVVDTASEQLEGEPARLLSAKLREKFAFCIQGRYYL